MIRITTSGSTKRTEAFLNYIIQERHLAVLKGLAEQGVDALRANTPVESGLTAESWTYEIDRSGGVTIWWKNTHNVDGFNVAIGLQYGHGTGTGGWVAGYDYINPAIRPVFDKIADAVWKEVQNA